MKRGVFFGEAMPLAEERTLRYGQEKQRSVIKKVAFAAQRLASKHALIILWLVFLSYDFYNTVNCNFR